MMLYPSIDDLLEKESSKYSLIIMASKRARELHEYKVKQLENYRSEKYVGRALEEVAAGVLSKKR